MKFKESNGQSVIQGQSIEDPNSLLWSQYSVFVDLFKFYLDIAVKSNIWFYTISGAILTFYFANPDNSYIKFSLVLPVILGLGFGAIFMYGSVQAKDMKSKITYIGEELRLPGVPHVDVLIIFLRFSSVLLFIISIAILVLLNVNLTHG